ncbi:transposase [Pseudomonas cavernicola]|uniref:Transposase n=1 Tax=Pseudomonas cavernicola TaxID=2320866 RepID=A0A418XIV7_9PSED|nr:transposase [Pseudomonas cavernicola]RJG12371.1 transposase [Pseudomonas cavernicola]
MPRKHRMYLPGVPAHVVQRGNNRAASFFHEDDYRFYLAALADALKRYRVELHAYVLMTNHVHLLMTPADTEGISRVMQNVGRLYVLNINRTHRHTGTLWEGRHKASLVNAAENLLTCYRYIELNPLRAGMVAAPEEYPWSSYGWHAWGMPNGVVADHLLYQQLGEDASQRQQAYRQLFTEHLEASALHVMREALTHNYPLGNERFRESVERNLGRVVGQCNRWRPPLKNKFLRPL